MEPTPHTAKGFKRGILFTTSSATLMRLLLSASPHPTLFLPGKEEHPSPGTEGDISQLELTVQPFPSPPRTSHVPALSAQAKLRKPELQMHQTQQAAGRA